MPTKTPRSAQVADAINEAARAASAQMPPRPTLAQIRRWPPTVDLTDAARALGIGRTTAYDWVREGKFPVPVISVGGQRIRTKVPTAALIRLLEGKAA